MLAGEECAGAIHHDDAKTTEDVGDEPDEPLKESMLHSPGVSAPCSLILSAS